MQSAQKTNEINISVYSHPQIQKHQESE